MEFRNIGSCNAPDGGNMLKMEMKMPKRKKGRNFGAGKGYGTNQGGGGKDETGCRRPAFKACEYHCHEVVQQTGFMVDKEEGGLRMTEQRYHPKRDFMNTSQTIGVLFAAGAILLPSCETERVNERPIGIYPTENVYPSGSGGMGLQGNSLLGDVQQESPLNPAAGQNSGFNPDPAQINSGTINRIVGGNNNITPPPPVTPIPTVANPVGDPSGNGIAAPRPVEPAANSSIPVAWPTSDPTVVVSPYDRTKKIKILNRSTNKPYPSGTVLRDTNFPTEVKKFRVP